MIQHEPGYMETTAQKRPDYAQQREILQDLNEQLGDLKVSEDENDFAEWEIVEDVDIYLRLYKEHLFDVRILVNDDRAFQVFIYHPAGAKLLGIVDMDGLLDFCTKVIHYVYEWNQDAISWAAKLVEYFTCAEDGGLMLTKTKTISELRLLSKGKATQTTYPNFCIDTPIWMAWMNLADIPDYGNEE